MSLNPSTLFFHYIITGRLWTAPELLRLPEIPSGGTQKGDVYSYGVISQEIMYREGVYFVKDVDIDPEGMF